MKYSYTNNGISFSNITIGVNPIKKIGGKLQSTINDFEYPEDGISPLINAVEIDWNSAMIGEMIISNSCESHCSMVVPSVAA